jgi:pyruvate dehydrogenase E2 component (dihydrolipoamide acetyltransferase)
MASLSLARNALARAASRSHRLSVRFSAATLSSNNTFAKNPPQQLFAPSLSSSSSSSYSPFDGKTRWFATYPPHDVVGMPSLSPTMEAGTISAWNVKEGSSFAAGDVLCSVETDKATVDFEAQDEGVVAKIIIEAGAGEIKCGTPIMVTVQDGVDVAAFRDFVVEAAGAESSSAAATATATVPAVAAAPPMSAPAAAAAAVAAPTRAAAPETGERIFASPRAHTLARERGYGEVSALRIVGTGPGGRIIARDVLEYDPSSATAVVAVATAPAAVAAPAAAVAAVSPAPAPAPAAAAAPAAASLPGPVAGPGYTDYSLAPPALELASRLHASKQNVPHYYLTIDLSLDALLQLRSTLNSALNAPGGGGITVNDLLMKAAAAAMKAVPAANSSWLGDKVRVYDSVDINVVVGGGSDLHAPVIRDVGRRGLKAISDDAAAAAASVVGGGGDPAAAPGFGDVGTFTVVNLGMFGVKSCAPIIREPQACALALGAIENRIVPNDDPEGDDIYKESVMMTATLSCDHRVVDGAVGAGWMSAFKNHVENPVTLLL